MTRRAFGVKMAFAVLLVAASVGASRGEPARAELRDALRAAQAVTPVPYALAAAIRESEAPEVAEGETVAERRGREEQLVARLHREVAASRLAASTTVRDDDLGRRCAPILWPGACRVEGFGNVDNTPFPTTSFRYQLQMRENGVTGVMVYEFTSYNDRLHPVIWYNDGNSVFEAPRFYPQHGGLLVIEGVLPGSIQEDRSLAFLWSDERWQEIDGWSWRDEFRRRLPAGLEVRGGLRVRYPSLMVRQALWREDDASCCPSGGEVAATLRLNGRRLTIVSYQYRQGRR